MGFCGFKDIFFVIFDNLSPKIKGSKCRIGAPGGHPGGPSIAIMSIFPDVYLRIHIVKIAEKNGAKPQRPIF